MFIFFILSCVSTVKYIYEIVPLRDLVTRYKITHAGTQDAQ